MTTAYTGLDGGRDTVTAAEHWRRIAPFEVPNPTPCCAEHIP